MVSYAAAVTAAQALLDAFAARQEAAGAAVDVGTVLTVLPARCLALDHAAIAWAHASGLPSPASPDGLAAELIVTTTGLAYRTVPVPYVWWRPWDGLLLSVQAVRRWRFRYQLTSVFATDRMAPFEGRVFELSSGAARALMGQAVEHGAVRPG